MREGPNAKTRDLLPELVHGTLNDAQRAEVEAHVAGCDACRDEVALLQRVRMSLSSPSVDTAAIARAIPAYRSPGRRGLAPVLRIAAALVLVAGAASLVMRNGPREPVVTDTIAQASPTPPVLSLGENFHDLSDSDLEALTDELQALDAVLSEEPEEIVVPLTGGTGS